MLFACQSSCRRSNKGRLVAIANRLPTALKKLRNRESPSYSPLLDEGETDSPAESLWTERFSRLKFILSVQCPHTKDQQLQHLRDLTHPTTDGNYSDIITIVLGVTRIALEQKKDQKARGDQKMRATT